MPQSIERAHRSYPWQRRRRRSLYIFCVALAALAVPIALSRLHRGHAIRALLEAGRSKGLPATLEELGAWHSPPPQGPNAGDLYRSLPGNEKYDVSSYQITFLIEATGNAPPRRGLGKDVYSNLERMLSPYQEILSVSHEAAHCETCLVVPDDPRKEIFDWTFLRNIQSIERMHTAEAMMHAGQGRSKEAAEAIVSMAAPLACFREQYLWPLQTFVFRQHQAIAQVLEHALNALAFDDEDLACLDETVLRALSPDAIVRTIAGSRLEILDESAHPELLINPEEMRGWQQDRLHKSVLFGALRAKSLLGMDTEDAAGFIRDTDALIDAARTSTAALLKTGQALRLSANGIRQDMALRRVMTDRMIRTSELFVQSVAHMLLVRTAIAAERYRIGHGAFPVTLADLVPGYLDHLPGDPFLEGEPLHYRTLEGGYLLYSVGHNHQDEGGTDPQNIYMTNQGDVVFRVERGNGT